MFNKKYDMETLELFEGFMERFCAEEVATCTHDGSKAFGRFGSSNRESRAFTKSYTLYLKAGRLLLVPSVDIKLVFDYRVNIGFVRMTYRAKELLMQSNRFPKSMIEDNEKVVEDNVVEASLKPSHI